MANPKHVDILKQGVVVWNKWRLDNPGVAPDLFEAKLRDANLFNANLRDANLIGADLRNANLSRANLGYAMLDGANLTLTKFIGADLRHAILNKTNLLRADFHKSNLENTDFRNSILSNSIFSWVRLSGALNLESCNHHSSSILHQSTLHFSPNLPIEFLRGCGLSDAEIEFSKLYRKGLTGQQITGITDKIHELYTPDAIQFYSCFISYSSQDEKFTRKLHDQLQDSGVRTWFAPEDMKIGDWIEDRIYNEIQLHDKLLLVLSEQSVKSNWVQDEVRRAFAREKREGRPVLFPIRIDDSILNASEPWAQMITESRHIGDLSQWQDDTAFEKGFDRLLRDLRESR